jgi:hypothetical protein
VATQAGGWGEGTPVATQAGGGGEAVTTGCGPDTEIPVTSISTGCGPTYEDGEHCPFPPLSSSDSFWFFEGSEVETDPFSSLTYPDSLSPSSSSASSTFIAPAHGVKRKAESNDCTRSSSSGSSDSSSSSSSSSSNWGRRSSPSSSSSSSSSSSTQSASSHGCPRGQHQQSQEPLPGSINISGSRQGRGMPGYLPLDLPDD